jgi:hypothetical protein
LPSLRTLPLAWQGPPPPSTTGFIFNECTPDTLRLAPPLILHHHEVEPALPVLATAISMASAGGATHPSRGASNGEHDPGTIRRSPLEAT